MANAEQILSLIRNHLNNDDAQFRKIALQISAVEAKNGHVVIARTIQDLLKQKQTSFGTLSLTSRNKDGKLVFHCLFTPVLDAHKPVSHVFSLD